MNNKNKNPETKQHISPDDIKCALFKTANNIPYAVINGQHRQEVLCIHSQAMRDIITKKLYEKNGKAPSKSTIDQIQDTLAARAKFEGDTKKVWTRTAKTETGIEIDLNDDLGLCVSITKEGWDVMRSSTVYFERPASSRNMPTPISDGSWELFKKHFKTRSEGDLRLLIGFMSSCFRPKGPYPVLVLQGEQGSAKSTTARMIKALVDPSAGATRSAPKKEQDLFIAAQNSHLLSFDNISLIKNDFSDALCRIATSGTFATRSLYTNNEEFQMELCKPIILNGITDFVNRADLASRSIIIELAPIPESERKSEEQVMSDFYGDLPLMLGVLMDSVASALKYKDSTSVKCLPRMADTAIWVTAAEKGLGWPENSFLEAFQANQLNALLTNLSTDSVAIALRNFLFKHPEKKWSGTATKLLGELTQEKPIFLNTRSWPDTPSYLSTYLARLAPNLRKIGIGFDKDRSSSQRLLSFVKLDNFDDMNPNLIDDGSLIHDLDAPHVVTTMTATSVMNN